MLFWKRKPKKPVKSKPDTSLPNFIPKPAPKPITPPPTRKIDIPNKPQKKPVTKPEDPQKEFLQTFKRLTYRHRAWDVWRDFITMFACAISNAVDKERYDEREKLYMKTIKKYNKQEQLLFPELVAETVMALERNQEQDFLGKIFMELDLGDKNKAQIFTPYSVCDLMARISLDEVVPRVKKEGFVTICDPCCGAGATLIAALNEARKQLKKVGLNFQNHVLITAQDVDCTTALMCYIQLSLLGMAAYIKVGNTLTEPMTNADTLENYWFTPIYFSDVWAMRRIFRRL